MKAVKAMKAMKKELSALKKAMKAMSDEVTKLRNVVFPQELEVYIWDVRGNTVQKTKASATAGIVELRRDVANMLQTTVENVKLIDDNSVELMDRRSLEESGVGDSDVIRAVLVHAPTTAEDEVAVEEDLFGEP
jgi:CRISPR/Cas system Type II protein with McrA/HNH and RuvC-like nuclease domain